MELFYVALHKYWMETDGTDCNIPVLQTWKVLCQIDSYFFVYNCWISDKNISCFCSMFMPCSYSKHNRLSPATRMKLGNSLLIFHAFYAAVIVTSCTVHALFIPNSCMFMPMNMHELSMNKGVDPKFHAHESYSHAHEVLP